MYLFIHIYFLKADNYTCDSFEEFQMENNKIPRIFGISSWYVKAAPKSSPRPEILNSRLDCQIISL